MRPGDEEHWSGTVRVECKSGAQARPVLTRFLLSEGQSEQHRPYGDHRPFIATFEHDGRAVFVGDLSRIREIVAALVEGLNE